MLGLFSSRFIARRVSSQPYFDRRRLACLSHSYTVLNVLGERKDFKTAHSQTYTISNKYWKKNITDPVCLIRHDIYLQHKLYWFGGLHIQDIMLWFGRFVREELSLNLEISYMSVELKNTCIIFRRMLNLVILMESRFEGTLKG